MRNPTSVAVRRRLTWGTRMWAKDKCGDSSPTAQNDKRKDYLWLLAWAKRLLISSQLTTFHQAAR